MKFKSRHVFLAVFLLYLYLFNKEFFFEILHAILLTQRMQFIPVSSTQKIASP